MQRRHALAGMLLVLGGCLTPTPTERARPYLEDAQIQFQQGNYAAARESYHAALQQTPDDVSLIHKIAETYALQGAYPQAEQYYVEVLKRMPNDAGCRHALAKLLVGQGRWHDAARMVEDWMRQAPDQAGPYAEDGWLWLQVNDLPKARDRFQKALELDPANQMALIELAGVYERMSRPDRALVLYERLLVRDPDHPQARQRLEELKAQGVERPRPD